MKNKEIIYFFFLLIFVLCLILTFEKHEKFKYSLAKQDQDVEQDSSTSFFYHIQMKDGVPLIKIKLGSNGTQRVIVDTGSSLLNVAHRNCIGCSKSNGTYNENINAGEERQMKEELEFGVLS